MNKKLAEGALEAPYPIYLLVVNALAFLLLTVDSHVCMRTVAMDLSTTGS